MKFGSNLQKKVIDMDTLEKRGMYVGKVAHMIGALAFLRVEIGATAKHIGVLIWRSMSEVEMFIQKRSMISGKINEMELPITSEQFEDWQSGRLIQHAMPHLNDHQREFLMSGITPEEWVNCFGEDD